MFSLFIKYYSLVFRRSSKINILNYPVLLPEYATIAPVLEIEPGLVSGSGDNGSIAAISYNSGVLAFLTTETLCNPHLVNYSKDRALLVLYVYLHMW